MIELSFTGVAVMSFAGAAVTHSASRIIIGRSANRYPTGVVIPGLFSFLLTGSFPLAAVALVSATVGHIASISISHKVLASVAARRLLSRTVT